MAGCHGVALIGRDFVRTCDALYGELLPCFSGRACGSRQGTMRRLCLEQQKTLMEQAHQLRPHLQAVAAGLSLSLSLSLSLAAGSSRRSTPTYNSARSKPSDST